MRNAPVSSHFDGEDSGFETEFPESPARLHLLLTGLVFFGCLVIILARITWVQTQLADRYLSHLDRQTIEYEVLPSRDGRIVAEDTVLAADVDQYSIQLHYRWLQDPADPVWMKQQIRERLSREERRNEKLVAKVEQELIAKRQRLRADLTAVMGLTPEEFETRRSRIQKRVEAIADSVNRRHSSSSSAATEEPPPEGFRLIGWIMQAASQVRQALTTTPSRTGDARIIVREEESWHTLVSSTDLRTAAAISEHSEQFPGTRVHQLTRRSYPEHTLAAHVVGARTAVRDPDDKSASGSEAIDANSASDVSESKPSGRRKGRFGIELSYDSALRGIPGRRKIVRNRRQQVISEEVIREPVSGRDISLTLDIDLQRLCEQLLAETLTDVPAVLLSLPQVRNSHGEETDARDNDPSSSPVQPVPAGGSIVVMEAATGRILAAASAPGFDLTLFTEGSTQAWEAANADQRWPFLSRFTGMALPPGSTFKMVTAAAGLQTGIIEADASFQCQGFLETPGEHRCLIFRHFGKGHGRVNLKMALAESCNVYFFDAARRMGIQPLHDWTEQFGFGQRTGIDLPFEKAGTIPRPPTTSVTADGSLSIEAIRRRFEREALGMSIGQSRLTVTPVQMARMMAAVVNGGWLVTPHIATPEGSAHYVVPGEAVADERPRIRIDGLTDQSLMAIREGLTAVVEEPYGTGFKTVRLNHVRIGGKTGTAESAPGKPDHAWFAGFAPADDPQIVFVIVLEHGGSGSQAAGPVAREIVRHVFPDTQDKRLSHR